MKFFAADLRRIFTEPATYLSMTLNMFLLFGAYFYLAAKGETADLYTSAQALALPFAAPVLAAMPYSTMIMQERETKYAALMSVKLCSRGYQLKRLVTAGISGAAVLFIPQFILFFVCMISAGAVSTAQNSAALILPLTFGFGYAAISYGLTFVNRHRYVPLVMPQVLYLLCIYAFPHLKLEKFYPPLDIAPSIYGGEITVQRFAIPAILTAAALVLALFGKVREKEWQN